MSRLNTHPPLNEATHVSGMCVDDFIALPGCARQRDTEKHAAYAVKRHLSEYSDEHAQVNVGMLPRGALVKLDGHTRALLWSRGELERPVALLANMYYCRDQAEANARYGRFDNRQATEQGSHMVQGALRENDFEPTSAYLKRGAFALGVRSSYGAVMGSPPLMHGKASLTLTSGDAIYDAMREWRAELLALDAMEPARGDWSTGMLVSYLLSTRAAAATPEQALRVEDFWRRYCSGLGDKIGKNRDGVEALSHYHFQTKGNARPTWARSMGYFGSALSAIERDKKGETKARLHSKTQAAVAKILARLRA